MLHNIWHQVAELPDRDACERIEKKQCLRLIPGTNNIHELCVYDSFDWLLWQAGKLLLQCDRQLQLVRLRDAKILQQYDLLLPDKDIKLSQLPAKLAAKLRPKLHPRIVFPRFRLSCRKTSFTVCDDLDKQLGQLLLYRFETGNTSTTVCGVGTAPLCGYDQQLQKLASALGADDAGGNLLQLLLADRLRCLVDNGYRSKPQPAFSGATPTGDVLLNYVRANLAVAEANLGGLLADRDPEFVHDFRVALRRSRALLSLFRHAFDERVEVSARQQLKEIAQTTNRLRDLDVWLLEADHYRSMLPEHMHTGFSSILANLKLQRKSALASVRRNLGHDKGRDLLNSIRASLTAAAVHDTNSHNDPASDALRPVEEVAPQIFDKHSKRITRLCNKINSQTTNADIHKIRIQCKKLRYLLELLQPIARYEAWKSACKSMKSLQDSLGRFNDLSVRQGFLQKHLLAPSAAGRLESQALLAAGGLASLIHRQQLEEKATALQALQAFTRQLSVTPLNNLFDEAQLPGEHP